MEYDPTKLGAVDAVEVVDLKDVLGNRVTTYMKEAADAPCVRVTGEHAQEIARLWRELPAGLLERCHIPSFGMRFFHEEKRVLQASICWRCNNIVIHKDDEELWYEFDAEHSSSHQLLALAQKIMS